MHWFCKVGQPGADIPNSIAANIKIPEPRYELKADEMQSPCGWIPYEGWQVTGKLIYTIIRGNVLVRKGEILGEPTNRHQEKKKEASENISRRGIRGASESH